MPIQSPYLEKTPLEKYRHWVSAIEDSNRRPAYLKIADLIEEDIDKGFLQAQDRLPPLRDLARLLRLNYTTVTRAYKEASNRGLIDSQPGSGSYIKGKTTSLPPRNGSNIEMTMNLPPEINDRALAQRIREDIAEITQKVHLPDLFRYQDFGGHPADKETGAILLEELFRQVDTERVLVCPGIHSALLSLLSLLCGKEGALCVSQLVYPGLKAIAAQIGVPLISVESDSDGPKIKAIEALCKTKQISALYVNPTIQNPSTITISTHRREAIADLAQRYSLPIIEDDAYGWIPETPYQPIAELAPDLVYYVNGLSKCFGAGCRIAYLYAPNQTKAQRIAGALRALNVMSSPITNALARQWIQNRTFHQVRDQQRVQSRERQQLAQNILGEFKPKFHPDAFHLWLSLPKHLHTNPSDLALFLRNHKVSAVAGAAFCTDNNSPEALRLCLGGPISIEDLTQRLNLTKDALNNSLNFNLI